MGKFFLMPHLGSFRARISAAAVVLRRFGGVLPGRAAHGTCHLAVQHGRGARSARPNGGRSTSRMPFSREGKGYKVRRRRRLFRRRRPAHARTRCDRARRLERGETKERNGSHPGTRSARPIRQGEDRRGTRAKRSRLPGKIMPKAIACSARRITRQRPRNSRRPSIAARILPSSKTRCSCWPRATSSTTAISRPATRTTRW